MFWMPRLPHYCLLAACQARFCVLSLTHMCLLCPLFLMLSVVLLLWWRWRFGLLWNLRA